MKVTITNADHTVDVEVPDDLPDLDIHELLALVRDLHQEIRNQSPDRTRVGFERTPDG